MAEKTQIPRLEGTLDGSLKDSEQKITSVKESPAGNFGSKESDKVLLHIYDLVENYLGSSQPSKKFKTKPNQDNDVNVQTKEILTDIGFSSSEFEVEIDYIRLLVGDHPESEIGGLYIDSISTSRDELVLKPAREVSDGSGQAVNDQISAFEVFPDGTMAEKKAVARNNGIIITDEGVIDELFIDFDFSRRYQIVNFFGVLNEDGIAEFSVKLANPLEQNIQVLEQGYVYQKVRNSEVVIADLRDGPESRNFNKLRKPNYDVDLNKSIGNDGSFKTFNDLISTQQDTSDKVLRDVLSGSFGGIHLNIDYSDYDEFVKYSSAHERLENFVYKMELIESYDAEIGVLQTSGGATGSTEVLADVTNLQTKKKNTIDKFTNYEKYLYFESSSYESSSFGQKFDAAWPKSNSTKPFLNYSVSSSQVINWLGNASEQTGQYSSASLYDATNGAGFLNNVPEHIKSDPRNNIMLSFFNMYGQHFDLLFQYASHISKISDRSNSVDKGMAAELIYHVAKNMGTELFSGTTYNDIWDYEYGHDVSGSYQQTGALESLPKKKVTQEILKRILNNLPLLYKGKGTERALRALINCYGIPTDVLRIKEYGGPKVFKSKDEFIEETFFDSSVRVNTNDQIIIPWKTSSRNDLYPNTVEFRFKGKKLSKNDNYTIVSSNDGNTASNDHWRIGYLSEDRTDEDLGRVFFAVKSGSGYVFESSSILPIFENEHYNVAVTRISSSGGQRANETGQFVDRFNIHVKKFNNGKVALTSSFSLDLDSVEHNNLFKEWSTGSRLVFGGTGNDTTSIYSGSASTSGSSIITKRASGSFQEIRFWKVALSSSVVDTHTLSPRAVISNDLTSSYGDLVGRWSFLSSSNFATNPTFSLDGQYDRDDLWGYATMSGFTGNRDGDFEFDEQVYFTPVPNIGPERLTSTKIRIESSSLEFGNLSPFRRSEVSAFDFAPVDSNKLGVFFSPIEIINRDILFDMGGGDLDGFIANPDDQYKPEYSQLVDLKEYFFKRYNGAFDYSLFIRTISRFDKSLFRQIKKMLPARAKSTVGFYLESHILERNKQKVANKPIVSQRNFRDTIDVGSEENGIIVPKGSKRSFIGEFDKTLVTELFGNNINFRGTIETKLINEIESSKRNFIGSFDTTQISELVGENRKFVGFITSSKTDFDVDGNFIKDERSIFQKSAVYNPRILITSKSGTVANGGEFNDQYFYASLFPDQVSPTGTIITGSRKSTLRQKKNLFYSSSLSASKDQKLGHLNNHFFAYSQSLEFSEYQDYKPGQDRAFFIGTKNTDETTIDGGPVVEIKTTNPNKLKVKKPGFKGGNLKVK
jgi:hypothetical protein